MGFTSADEQVATASAEGPLEVWGHRADRVDGQAISSKLELVDTMTTTTGIVIATYRA